MHTGSKAPNKLGTSSPPLIHCERNGLRGCFKASGRQDSSTAAGKDVAVSSGSQDGSPSGT